MTGKPKIVVRDVCKRFGPSGRVALEPVRFDINAGEVLGLLGPTGCGKTTLLRIIAQLLTPSSGEILRHSTEPGRLFDSMVFQDLALFPWKTVRENVALGRRFQRRSQDSLADDVSAQLRTLRLSDFESYYPHQLSGGMRQRVALARAFLSDPEVLLMDEPFGSLDTSTRCLLQEELLRLWQERCQTVLLVTHSIQEALLLCDRVLVLTAAPGRVKSEIVVPFPRPRSLAVREDPRFVELCERIWTLLRDEVELSLS